LARGLAISKQLGKKAKFYFFFRGIIIFLYICTSKFFTGLTDGVTVALQILVLPVQVRILVGQLIHQKAIQ
jgi:hypothetical protein